MSFTGTVDSQGNGNRKATLRNDTETPKYRGIWWDRLEKWSTNVKELNVWYPLSTFQKDFNHSTHFSQYISCRSALLRWNQRRGDAHFDCQVIDNVGHIKVVWNVITYSDIRTFLFVEFAKITSKELGSTVNVDLSKFDKSFRMCFHKNYNRILSDWNDKNDDKVMFVPTADLTWTFKYCLDKKTIQRDQFYANKDLLLREMKTYIEECPEREEQLKKLADQIQNLTY